MPENRSVSAPRLRADAARNRQAILATARELYGARGMDAPLDDIARRADVGNATLYRHFPSRCALIPATFADTLDRVIEAGERALEETDPRVGFTSRVRFLSECRPRSAPSPTFLRPRSRTRRSWGSYASRLARGSSGSPSAHKTQVRCAQTSCPRISSSSSWPTPDSCVARSTRPRTHGTAAPTATPATPAHAIAHAMRQRSQVLRHL